MMKWVLRIFLIFFILFLIISSIFFIKSYTFWLENKNRFLHHAQELNNLISQKKLEKQKQEFQLNEKGQITKLVSTKILDKNGLLVGEFFPAKHFIVYGDDVPSVLVDALISMEDSRFWKHKGIDFRGILRAFYYNIKYRRIVAGGSTITQQLSKLLFTSQKRTIFRKFLDMIAAVSLERHFTKKEILMMYLNTIYFGHGVYGLESASQFYFNKKARNLNYAESAMLIGLLGRPNYFTPFKHPKITQKKQRLVLLRMATLGYIKKSSIDSVSKQFWTKYENTFKNPTISFWKMDINEAPYYVEYIRQLLLKQFSEDDLLNKPLIVNTALNLELQKKVQSIVLDYMSSISTVSDKKEVALVVLNPKNGFVEALIGGTKFGFYNQLNRAVAMRRQIGSLVKPFLYATAMEKQNLSPQTIMTDQPLSFSYGNKTWKPHNYDNHYEGPITLTKALRKSINSISVQLLKHIGVANFVKKIHLIWGPDVPSKQNENLSISLGTLELSPLEVAKGYSVFAQNGDIYKPLFIRSVKNDNYISIISNVPERLNKTKIFSDTTRSNIRFIISGIIKKGGTGYRTAKRENFHFPIFGKTGTTSQYRDAWFCGFNDQYIVVAWVGYDRGQKSLRGSGGSLAEPLVLRIFKAILK